MLPEMPYGAAAQDDAFNFRLLLWFGGPIEGVFDGVQLQLLRA